MDPNPHGPQARATAAIDKLKNAMRENGATMELRTFEINHEGDMPVETTPCKQKARQDNFRKGLEDAWKNCLGLIEESADEIRADMETARRTTEKPIKSFPVKLALKIACNESGEIETEIAWGYRKKRTSIVTADDMTDALFPDV